MTHVFTHASVTRLSRSTLQFQLLSQKIDSILHSFYPTLAFTTQLWPALYAPNPSTLPLTNPFHALLTHALRPPAEHAIKHSFVATMSLYPSACSAIHNSHNLNSCNSDSPRRSSLANSHYTNKTSFSLKNKLCFLQHKLPSLMTASSKTLTIKFAMSLHKSSNSLISNAICCKLNVNCNDKDPDKIHQTRPIPSFTAAPIPTAMASSLPHGSAPPAKSTHAIVAGNSRLNAMIHFTFAILTPSLPLLF